MANNPAVLVVDDNVAIARAIVILLKAKGISGHCVYGGRDAMAWLGEHRPKLVILDISMPDISGVDVLKTIKADPASRDLPVILHTALEGNKVSTLAQTYGADGVLLKGRSTLVDVLQMVDDFGIRN
ncbi:MAG: divK 2 [Phycisphaerales bacterium]|nr:divK 2 [Phycisphaerales bacterium]